MGPDVNPRQRPPLPPLLARVSSSRGWQWFFFAFCVLACARAVVYLAAGKRGFIAVTGPAFWGLLALNYVWRLRRLYRHSM
jgi:hypothetical protein